MFSTEEIKRASRVVKFATATEIDPYTFNAGGYYNPSVKEMGWKQPEPPGLLKSFGQWAGGVALKPFDFARSTIGAAPGQSMARNYLGAYGPWLGSHAGGLLGWTPQQRQAMYGKYMSATAPGSHIDTGMAWAAPYARASAQSAEMRSALPKALSQHAWGRFLLHPAETSYKAVAQMAGPDRGP
jgi:hypothetical protein